MIFNIEGDYFLSIVKYYKFTIYLTICFNWLFEIDLTTYVNRNRGVIASTADLSSHHRTTYQVLEPQSSTTKTHSPNHPYQNVSCSSHHHRLPSNHPSTHHNSLTPTKTIPYDLPANQLKPVPHSQTNRIYSHHFYHKTFTRLSSRLF